METIPFGFLSARGGGLSVVGLLVFDRGNIVEVAVEPLAVEPVHPGQLGFRRISG